MNLSISLWFPLPDPQVLKGTTSLLGLQEVGSSYSLDSVPGKNLSAEMFIKDIGNKAGELRGG